MKMQRHCNRETLIAMCRSVSTNWSARWNKDGTSFVTFICLFLSSQQKIIWSINLACCAIEFFDRLRTRWHNPERCSHYFERRSAYQARMRVICFQPVINQSFMTCFDFTAFVRGPTGSQGYLCSSRRSTESLGSRAWDQAIKFSAATESTSATLRSAKLSPLWRTRRFSNCS